MDLFLSFKLLRRDETLSKQSMVRDLIQLHLSIKVSPLYEEHTYFYLASVNVDYGMQSLSQTTVDSSAQSLVQFGLRRLIAFKVAARASCRTQITGLISRHDRIFSKWQIRLERAPCRRVSNNIRTQTWKRQEKLEQFSQEANWWLRQGLSEEFSTIDYNY